MAENRECVGSVPHQNYSPVLSAMDVRSVKRRPTTMAMSHEDSGIGLVDRMQPQAKQPRQSIGSCNSTHCHCTNHSDSGFADYSLTDSCPCSQEHSRINTPKSSLLDAFSPLSAENRSPTHLSFQSLGLKEYSDDILTVLRRREVRLRPWPGYMAKQSDIEPWMRTILIDWMVSVAEEYKLHSQTLHLAVGYVDRFLSVMHVHRGKLQLVGATAVLVASKLEEITVPEISQFVYITDNTYSLEQIQRMEMLLLLHLQHEMAMPTSLCFLEHFASVSNCSQRVMWLAMFLCELTLLKFDPFINYLPSTVAAASLCLARHTLGLPAWTHELEVSSNYSFPEIVELVTELQVLFEDAPRMEQRAIIEKYRSTVYGSVGAISAPDTVPSAMATA
ncbi:G2/mitotic-specific cyclin-A-like [Sycon ciliatum]|uniref:G2/mitotic-specific cyclin-A-like n=1 Tax=Sycon ciliatum TaxID=27933 RepID=UPI0020AC7CC9